jgi:hypothetical protein
MKLNVVTPIHDNDLNLFISRIHETVTALNASFFSDWEWIVVIQSKVQISEKILKIILDFNVVVNVTERYSVSKARNQGIDYFNNSDGAIYFLDCDAVPAVELLNYFHDQLSLGHIISSGKIIWCSADGCKKKEIHSMLSDCSIAIPSSLSLFNTFLGCYCFSCDSILKTKVRFVEDIGPGDGTMYKAGEDALFISDLIAANNISWIQFKPSVSVSHPLRPSDNSKEILYARGQVHTYKIIIYNNYPLSMRCIAFSYLFMFATNGFIKVFFRKKNALSLLRVRLNSLWHD